MGYLTDVTFLDNYKYIKNLWTSYLDFVKIIRIKTEINS